MWKFLSGLFAGAAFTLGLVHWFQEDKNSETDAANPQSVPLIQPRVTEEHSYRQMGEGHGPTISDPASPKPARLDISLSVQPVATVAAAAPAAAQEFVAASPEPPDGDPYLSEDYAAIVEQDRQRPRNLAALHEEFITQSRDPAWADRAELQLAQALTEPAAKRGLVVMDVRCQKTLCEIQTLGTGHHAIGNWYDIVDRFRRKPDGREFGYVLWDSGQRDGQQYMLTIIERRPG